MAEKIERRGRPRNPNNPRSMKHLNYRAHCIDCPMHTVEFNPATNTEQKWCNIFNDWCKVAINTCDAMKQGMTMDKWLQDIEAKGEI